ncbi:MAG: type IV pilus secretin PilQ [Deltaproteobacteria bacterium]|nr:type IV pilus secretin PilQ [Deltaproteobacteria bacterium]
MATAHGAAAEPSTCRITAVRLLAGPAGAAAVVLETSAPPRFAARVAPGGLRLLVDLEDARLDGAEPAITEGRGVVASVLAHSYTNPREPARPPTTRLMVQLSRPARYLLRAAPAALHLELEPADKTEPVPAREAAGRGGPRRGSSPERADGASGSARVLGDVRFEHGAEADRVILDLGGQAAYGLSAPAPGRSLLELRGVRVPAALVRTLDVAAFGGPVRAVSTYRQPEREGRVVIDVDHDRDASGVVVRYGSSLHYIFSTGRAPASLTGIAPDGLSARRVRTVARELLAEPDRPAGPGGEAAQWTTEPDRAAGLLPASAAQVRRAPAGRRIDLDLKDADIHNVLRLIADVGNVNIVTSDNVEGNITIRMRNVPWDQALETVLQAKKLGMVRQGNIIRVAPAIDLQKEREDAIAKRKSELELAPIETRLIPVSYAKAEDLAMRSRELLSPRGSIAVDARTNVLITRDVAGNLNQVEELIRALDTQTPQVLIEARIVEATSRFQRDVGLQWGGDMAFSPATGNETGLVFPAAVGVVGGASDQQTPTGGLSPFNSQVSTPNFAVNLPATVGMGQGGALGLSFGSIDNTVNLAVRLSAAESSGMVRIVSSPRVLTLDNYEARINQGTLIPFSQISAQGVQTVFQEAKLQLLVKPHVTADGSVSMHVKINRDEPDFNQTGARGDPTILKREAETDLLVPDGHTAVIAGIYTRNTGRNLDSVPLLGDIPIIGVLFQRRRSSDTRSELVIFLTPRIVNRAESLGR